MSYFVFHDDDCEPDCEVGLREFDTEVEAIRFIDQRIAGGTPSYPRSLSHYTLIEGRKLEIEPYERVARVRAKR